MAVHTTEAGVIRHSFAANNGVMSLFSSNFTPVQLTEVDLAGVLKRLTLDNRTDTESHTKRTINLDLFTFLLNVM